MLRGSVHHNWQLAVDILLRFPAEATEDFHLETMCKELFEILIKNVNLLSLFAQTICDLNHFCETNVLFIAYAKIALPQDSLISYTNFILHLF